MTMRKAFLAQRAKPLGGKSISPFLGVVPGSIAFKGFDDPGQGGDPGNTFVADVPDQSKEPPGFKTR